MTCVNATVFRTLAPRTCFLKTWSANLVPPPVCNAVKSVRGQPDAVELHAMDLNSWGRPPRTRPEPDVAFLQPSGIGPAHNMRLR